MRPILFTVFGFPVRSYGLFIVVGILAGLWLARRINARRRPQYIPMMEDFLLYAVFAAILGARIWEVTFTWDYYREHLWEIPAVWHGGLSIQGAVLGAVIAAALFCRSRKVNFLDFADALTPPLLLGQAIGRLFSCFLNGDAFGMPTGTGFGIIYAPGSMAYETFGPVPLWPAEVFEGLWDLAIMGFALWLLKRGQRPGTVFFWYMLLYSLGRFSLEFLRADSLRFMGFKSAQVTSILFALIGAGMLLWFRHEKARHGAEV